ncbi:hypothetical protein [Ferrovibrio sp.]|uniref:hypothetical protein n=1 Tax=Ferrovibrio sp. TaxID=1917215 RepID=UPI002627F56F|nr:hypothetical protein [Ferrovibrio sp.]
MRNPQWFRILLLLLGGMSLFIGLCGGLWRLGWILPHGASFAQLHGPLMISGLFGTLISMERAVALGRPWAYLGPISAGLGSLMLVAGLPSIFGASAYLLASGALALASLLILRQQPALFTAAMLFGALAWLTGNMLWLLGGAMPDLVGWWLAFLILTIAGERLEMSRLLPRKAGSEALFVMIIGLLAAGARNGPTDDNGAVLFGLGLLAATLWLFRHDIARRTVQQKGQTRFFAICMLLGYVWLGLAGAALLLWPPPAMAFGYDLALHAVLIGFVISMVFGHALIILPAVTQWRVAYMPWLYMPLTLLHLSMLLRAVGGLAEWPELRQVSGILTVLAIMAFMLTMAGAAWRSRRHRRSGQAALLPPGSALPKARS